MNKTQLTTAIAVVAGLVVVAIFFFVTNPFASSSAASSANTLSATQGSTAGLVAQDETVGTGAAAQQGDTVAVQYVGKLQDGTVFDQSSAHTQVMPGCTKAGELCFTVGAAQMIPGVDEGVVGMKVGGKRLLIIPPTLGYGANAVGPIPANSTLIFEITLDSITPPGSAPTPAQ